jgi:hypothetical protein
MHSLPRWFLKSYLSQGFKYTTTLVQLRFKAVQIDSLCETVSYKMWYDQRRCSFRNGVVVPMKLGHFYIQERDVRGLRRPAGITAAW